MSGTPSVPDRSPRIVRVPQNESNAVPPAYSPNRNMPSEPTMPPAEPDHPEALIQELRRMNALLEQQVRYHRSWKLPLRNGVIAGFGGVIGATLVVSLLVAALKPLRSIPALAPALQRIATALEHGK